MNKKQFESFKTWRTKKYERDLERKIDELASRGFASSSLRTKEEQWLKDEYHTDLERAESDTMEYEAEKKDRRTTSRSQRYTNYALSIAAIVSLIFAGITFSRDQNLSEYRPYVNIKEVEFVDLLHEKTIGMKMTLVNTGSVPANGVHITGQNYLDGTQTTHYDSLSDPFIPPLPTEIWHTILISGDEVSKYLSASKKWTIDISIVYTGISSATHASLLKFQFNPITRKFEYIGGTAN
jgi:hypothetical protein